MKKEKSFSKKLKIIMILFWVLVAILAVLFSFSSKWKTYSHSFFGFQFRYPSHYQIKEYNFFEGISVKVIDPATDVTYFEVNVYGLPETAVEIIIPEDPYLTGPYPKKIPANEKNGEITVIEKTLNNIQGAEAFGTVVEGRDFMDSFKFRKDGYEWRIELSPVGEGRIEKMPWETGVKTVFNQKNYERIKDSFSLMESK